MGQKMKIGFKIVSVFVLLSCVSVVANDNISQSQADDERVSETVVRNKIFYKPGKLELSPVLGIIPFDSVVSHFLAGGRLTWHLSDHFGWEILDVTLALPSVTDYARNLVKNDGISNLQANKLRLILGTNLLYSPMYGKFRFIGNSILHFDIYAVGGLGFTNTEVVQLVDVPGSAPQENILKKTWDPTLNFGFGFKFFLTDVAGLLIDFRDYFTYSEAYGKKRLASHFGANVGLSIFIPPF